MVYVREIIPFYARTIQVSELSLFAQSSIKDTVKCLIKFINSKCFEHSLVGGLEQSLWWRVRQSGGLEHEFYDFPSIGNFIIPTDYIKIFRRGRAQPPTSSNHSMIFPAVNHLSVRDSQPSATVLPRSTDVQPGRCLRKSRWGTFQLAMTDPWCWYIC